MASTAPLTAVVVDSGSATTKSGFGGEGAPRSEISTLVGQPRHPGLTGIMLGSATDAVVGQEAAEKRGLLRAVEPVAGGNITDWDAMQNLWHRVFFGELNVACEEHPLLVTAAPDMSRLDRETVAQLLFEAFNVPAIVIASTSVLSLYSTGRTAGIVIDSGAGRTHIGPIWEGYAMPHFLRRLDMGGATLTNHLFQKLRGDGYPFSTPADWATANDMKERLCYAADDLERESQYCRESTSIQRLYDLPDGQQVYMNEHRFSVPEAMFQPALLGLAHQQTPGIHQVVQETISLCDPAVHNEMYGSLVLAGGNTLFDRFDERLQREVAKIATKGATVRVLAFPERKYAAWLGGSIVSSLSTFPCMWVSKNEYDDDGPSIVHRKCI